ncbi:MAG: O-methyltransferase [Sphingobacteriaceae bacterium]
MFNWRFVKDYLSHQLFAKSRHGVHSPFVYQLVDKVIYNFRANEGYLAIEALRKQLLTDEREITVTDLGAGSHLNKNRTKQVRAIATNALKKPRLAQLIYRLARNQQAKSMLELGTCLGITTAYLAKACPDANLVTVEGCPQTAAIARENFNAIGLENIDLQVGNFDEVLPAILNEHVNFDFVYIDGNHRKEATLRYFKLFLPQVTASTLLIFDDIYWSKGMKEAWQEIRENPKVTVSVDLFWIGLVFFKPGKVKENFKIRF